MTLDERHNEVIKSHAAFLNAVGVAAAGGAGFAAIGSSNWALASAFIGVAVLFHIIAADLLAGMKVTNG
ncbi:MAG: hypothetical protein JNJ73_01275 [Hyphomonadaceae bacterium]|nr:hypothetical protein [Hyphomonadaceae bacterium]